MLLLELLLGLIRFLLGAALFSFMNVVAWRLPRGMDPLKGRSVCPQCGHTLGVPDLVPVFSWLFLARAVPPLRCAHSGAVPAGGASGRRAGAGLHLAVRALPTPCRADCSA